MPTARIRFVITVAVQLGLASVAAAQTIHTAHDHIPNFAANPSIRSVSDGAWSSASTWTPAQVPGAGDVVSIAHAVTYDTTSGDVDVIGVEAGGMLRFSTSQATRLRVGTLIVLPGGTLQVGTPSNPVLPSITAEIIIKDQPLNTSIDPDQYGTGLLSIDGHVTMHGAVKSPTFARADVEPRAGHTEVTLDRAVSGWRVGDRVFLPDTRQVHPDDWFNPNFPLRVEERAIQSISSDGRRVTLSSALSFDHRGARDADGTPTVLSNGIKLLPHLGNLTRNVIVRSENPSGTRGHTLFTQRSTVNISYVQFQDLGRTRAVPLHAMTNHIGRYPVHIHHVWGPVNPGNTGYQFSLIGNAVNDSLKWPIAVHGSHFGLVRQNVVFGGAQLTGAGIAVEDGTETQNLFEENFVAYIRGATQPRDSGPNTADGTTPGSAAECFWSNGFNNRFVNNVAASCRNTVQQIVSGPGWKFIVPAAPYIARIPRFRGADMTKTGETQAVTPQYQPILEFRGNEVYGLAADGLTAWELGTDGYAVPSGIAQSLIKDFRVWHTYEGAVYNYPAHRMTIDGLVYRIDPAATVYWPAAISVRRLSQHRRHHPQGKHPRRQRHRWLHRPAGCLLHRACRCGDARSRIFVRNTGDPGHRRGPASFGCHGGAAQQRRASVAGPLPAHDRNAPRPFEGQQPAQRHLRHLRVRLSGAAGQRLQSVFWRAGHTEQLRRSRRRVRTRRPDPR